MDGINLPSFNDNFFRRHRDQLEPDLNDCTSDTRMFGAAVQIEWPITMSGFPGTIVDNGCWIAKIVVVEKNTVSVFAKTHRHGNAKRVLPFRVNQFDCLVFSANKIKNNGFEFIPFSCKLKCARLYGDGDDVPKGCLDITLPDTFLLLKSQPLLFQLLPQSLLAARFIKRILLKLEFNLFFRAEGIPFLLGKPHRIINAGYYSH